mgnify:CR=1 FL=1
MGQQGNRTYCGVVDEDKKLIGMVTKSDISVIGLYDTARSIAIMAQTPLDNFRKTLEEKSLIRWWSMTSSTWAFSMARTDWENSLWSTRISFLLGACMM